MFLDFSENSPWKLNILVPKGGSSCSKPWTPSKPATDTCLVYRLSDYMGEALSTQGCIWYFYYENFDGLLSFWWVCKKLIKFLSILAFYLRQYRLLNLAYDRLHISTQNYT